MDPPKASKRSPISKPSTSKPSTSKPSTSKPHQQPTSSSAPQKSSNTSTPKPRSTPKKKKKRSSRRTIPLTTPLAQPANSNCVPLPTHVPFPTSPRRIKRTWVQPTKTRAEQTFRQRMGDLEILTVPTPVYPDHYPVSPQFKKVEPYKGPETYTSSKPLPAGSKKAKKQMSYCAQVCLTAIGCFFLVDHYKSPPTHRRR